ncbi:hypothetical protein [Sinorhizobium terangae]|uniref:hypothetical protein n=1 Tax=Sinorhizobium terangae TaxID=110322 RepID=UPI0024B1DD3D|nr:hypothetical protein [Sinorhizobium terangae]WFU49170.1 hypothetical protein QA637_07165 [Sinorhizobium terangae]
MTRDNRWKMQEALKDVRFVFAAAKKDCPQLVFDDDGVFTISFDKHGKKGSGRTFLTSGGPDEG